MYGLVVLISKLDVGNIILVLGQMRQQGASIRICTVTAGHMVPVTAGHMVCIF